MCECVRVRVCWETERGERETEREGGVCVCEGGVCVREGGGGE